MSDVDFFSPTEGGESYDPSAFERFKEQMKKNAAFISAAKKDEARQKQKEDRLAQILLAFIQKRGILLLAAQLLRENIPPSFVLSILILGNEDIKMEFKNALAAYETSVDTSADTSADVSKKSFHLETQAVSVPMSNKVLPVALKVEIDAWIQHIYETASASPFRILETSLDKAGQLKQVVIDCAANVFDDFCASNSYKEISYENCFSFCELFLKKLMQELKRQIENQSLIK